MADGLWLSTISYEPSAINYRLYIKIAFIRYRVINDKFKQKTEDTGMEAHDLGFEKMEKLGYNDKVYILEALHQE